MTLNLPCSTRKLVLLLMLSFGIFSFSAKAQLAGIYSIDNTIATGGTNYNSFSAAVSALNSLGVSAPVTFNVGVGQTFNEQISVNQITGASAINTITFNGNNSTITFAATNVNNANTIRLDGADFIRFNNLDILATGTSFANTVFLRNGADNNIFDNCTISTVPNTTTNLSTNAFIIANHAYYPTIPSGTLAANNNNLVQNCVLKNGLYAYVDYGTATNHNFGNRIVNCDVEDAFRFGIYIENSDDVEIVNNEVSRPNRTLFSTTADYYQIVVYDALNTLIEKNHIFSPYLNATPLVGHDARGIFVRSRNTGSDRIKIINNVIENFENGFGSQGGIVLFTPSSNVDVWHNTIAFNSPQNATSIYAGTYGISLQHNVDTGIDIRNNIVSITRNGSVAKSGISISTANTLMTCDYNNVYVTGTNGRYANVGATLAVWQTLNGGAWGQNSNDQDPNFTNPGATNFQPQNGAIDDVGIPVGVTDDFTNTTRSSTTPDVGAFEWDCIQMAGVYTINPGLAASATNFTTIDSAVSRLQGCGISGPVVFNFVASGTFVERIDIPEIVGSSAINTVTFNGNGSIWAQFTVASSAVDRHVLRLSGADYFRFNNFEFQAGGSAGFGTGVHLYNASNHNIFDSCTILLSVLNNTGGTAAFGISTAPVIMSGTSTFPSCDSNALLNSTIVGGNTSVACYGSSVDILQHVEIRNCELRDARTSSIFLFSTNNAVVAENDIANPNKVGIGSPIGIYLNQTRTNALIEKNYIHDLAGAATSTTSSLSGISILGGSAVNPKAKIINNVIGNFNSAGYQYGIRSSTADVIIHHNTIDLSSLVPTASSSYGTYGIYALGGSALDIRNNNISITRNGIGTKSGMYFNSTSINSDYNNIYVNGPQNSNYTGYFSTTLAIWQSYLSGAFDQNSTAYDPFYVNASAGDFTPSNGFMNSTGTNLGVGDDINGLTRSVTTPDVGAFEWNCSAVSGTYTINPAAPISATNVQTFQEAVNLLSCGINGPVVFNVIGVQTFTEQIDIPQIVGSSATNTVTFNGNGSTLTNAITTNTFRHTLRLSGADYFRFINWTIAASNTTYAHAVHLYNASNHNIFDSCIISVPANFTSTNLIPFIITASASNSFTSNGSTCDSNEVRNTQLLNGYGNVYILGSSTTSAIGNQIVNCDLRDAYSRGAFFGDNNGTILDGSQIHRPTRTSSSTYYALRLENALNFRIQNNHIHNPFQSLVTSTLVFYGMYISGAASATSPNYIINNLIEDIDHRGRQYGIYLLNSVSHIKAWHNTIDLSGAQPAIGSNVTYGIYAWGTGLGKDFQNNNITITRNGTAQKYGVYFNSTNITSDYNNIYVNGPQGTNYIGYVYQSLAQWQAFAGGAFGQNSTASNPNYTNPATNDYTPFNGALDNTGTNLGVLNDINGSARSTTSPDVGAFEWNCIPINGVYTINPALPYSATNMQTMQDAIDLLTCGINGPVVFNAAPGLSFNEQLTIPQITGSSSANTVTFNGFGDTITHNSNNYSNKHILRLGGADYFRFNNWVIDGTSSLYATGVHIYNASNNNIFNNCIINISATNTGVYSHIGWVISTNDVDVTSTILFPTCDSNALINSEIRGGSYGAHVWGSSADTAVANMFYNTKFYDFYRGGLNVRYTNSITADSCEFARPTRINSNSSTQAFIGSFSFGIRFRKNHIHSLITPSLQAGNYSLYGVYITSSQHPTLESYFDNNLIEDFNSASGNNGFYFSFVNNLHLRHNTIVLDGAQATSSIGYGIRAIGSGLTNVNVLNNNIYLDRNQTGSSYSYGLYFQNEPSWNVDYNNVYLGNPNCRYGQIVGSVFSPDLGAWQNAAGGIYGQNSTSENPLFANAASNDFTPTNGILNNSGTNVGVATDIVGATRTLATPDVGAYEWNCGPVSGTFTINPALPAVLPNFQTFQDAVNHLLCGISAPVVFNVAPGNTFNEQVDIPQISGSSATNTVTFNGNGSTLTNGNTSNTIRHTLRLRGADFFRFNNLDITGTDTNYAHAVHLFNASNDNIFDSCIISVPNAQGSGLIPVLISAAPYYSGSGQYYPSCDSNTFSNCITNYGLRGFEFQGPSLDTIYGNKIINCKIRDARIAGVHLVRSSNTLISGNEIYNPTRANFATSGFYGISLSTGVSNSLVEKNHIHSPFVTNTTLPNNFYGIFNYASGASAGKEILIENNLIENIRSRGGQAGIIMGGSQDHTQIRHNTIVLDDPQIASVNLVTYGISSTNASAQGLDIRNNNIYIDRAVTSSSFLKNGLAVYSSSAICDYNNVYLGPSGSTTNYGRFGSTSYPSLANWQTANGGTFGQNSTSLDPVFANPLTDDYTPTANAVIGTGVALGLVDDILDSVRSLTTPTVGAFEAIGCSPLAGTYTIDPSLPISTTNYHTFNAVVADLCACDISAPVVFNVAAGNTFNEQLDICEVVGASVINTITFNGNGSTLAFAATSSPNRHTLRLNGSDYFRFNNLNIAATGTSYGNAVHLYDGADHNIFDSCILTVPANVTSNYHPFVVSTHPFLGSNLGTAAGSDSNTIQNCIINSGSNGIAFSSATDTLVGNQIINNEVRDVDFISISCSRTKGMIIRGNEVHRPTRTTLGNHTGIYLVNSSQGLIEKNNIHNLFAMDVNSTNSARGITVTAALTSPSQKTIIVNNLVTDFDNGLGAQTGVYLGASAQYVDIHHNTFSFNSQQNAVGTVPVTSGIIAQGTSHIGVDIKNNIIYINRGGTAQKQGLNFGSSTLNLTCDYNTIYVQGAGVSNYANLAQTLSLFQNLNGGVWGQNSKSVDPFFVNPALGNYQPSNGIINDLGTPLGVLDDITNVVRSTTTPDVGAYEFTCTALAGIYTINPSLPLSVTNFQTFEQAVCALCNCGISAAVVFNVASGNTFNEQVDICEVNGTSATNTITFNGNNSTLSYSATNAAPYTIRMNGADYVTFRNLNIQSLNTIDGIAYYLYNAANNNTIDSCTLSVPQTLSTNNIPLVHSSHPTQHFGFASGLACDSFTLTNSTVQNGHFNAKIHGIQSTVIDNNIFTDPYRSSLYIRNSSNIVLRNNDISRPTRTLINNAGYIIRMIEDTNSFIGKNHLHDLYQSNTTSIGQCWGIFFQGGSNSIIQNNLIESIHSRGTQTGIYISGLHVNANILHNTIVFDDMTLTNNATYGIENLSSTTQITNNNIVLTRNTIGNLFGYIHYFGTSDYNNVYVNGAGNNYYGRRGTTNFTTLNNWQSATFLDSNSTSVDPLFVNPALVDYTPSNSLTIGTGAPLGVTDDILDSLRSLTAPTVGAFEAVCLPMAGTYTINPALPSSLTNFQSFNSAVANMCACGISAPVVFNVVPSNIFNEQVDICEISGASAVNTVTFNGNGGTLTHAATSSTPRYTLRLSGTDYTRFNNLNIAATGATYGYAVHLYDEADNNIFDSCTLSSSTTSTATGINHAGFVISTDENFVAINGSYSGCDSNQLINSTISGGRYGIALYGKSADRPHANILRNNLIQDFYENGIRITNTNYSLLEKNDINKLNRNTGTTFYGIRSGSDINALVSKNHVHHPFGNTTTSSSQAHGIYFAGNVSTGADNLIVNNLIEDFNSLGNQIGIYIASSARWLDVYHNTIDLSGNLFNSSSITNGIYCLSNNTGIDLLNNNITISRSGTQIKHGIRIPAGNNASANYNNVYLNAAGSLNYYGQYGATNYTNLANWQTANAGAYGQNSTDIDPQYANIAINDYNPTNLALDNTASALGVLDDIEDIIRSTTNPDVGAFEFGCTGLSTIVTNFTTATDTTISCFGAMDGQVSVQSSLGIAPYTYYLLPGSSSNTTGSFSGLDTGSYLIVVLDASSCIDSIAFNVTQPDSLVIDSIVAADPSCNPSNNGSLTVYASGGTTAYSYDIGGTSQTSNSFTGLTANTYTVTVTDANNCTATTTISLMVPSIPLVTSALDTNVSCNGVADGSIAIMASSGGPITYTLNPGAITNTTGYFNNLVPNTYTVTVNGANNCTVDTSFVITQPLTLSIDSLTASNPSCNPGNDGSLVVNASGGTLGYRYNIGGANQSSNTFPSLAANTYLVTVTDTNSCTDTMSVTLVTPSLPTITSTLDTNISCNGAGDGSIAVTGTGASAITYTLNPGAVTNSSGYFNNLTPNTYTVTLSDASNCTVSTTVTITEPIVLNIDSLTTTNPTCAPGGDGSIVVNSSGGTAGFQYDIGAANQLSNTFSNLGSATYLVTVSDTNSCTDTMSVTITAPSAPTIVSSADTNISCIGAADGSILITATGTGAINYNLQPANITNTTGYFGGLGPNSYSVTATDASGCTVSTTVNITEPAQLNIDSLTSTLPTCAPGNDGSIIVNATGGTTPYQYNIGGANQNSNTFNNLASGIYLVTVIDTNACTDTLSIDLSAPNAPVITSTLDTNVTCNGLADGSIQVTGTAATTITYTLNPGAVSNATGYFNNLAPNSYLITLSDASNCTVSTTVTITQPIALNIDSLTSTLPSCAPGNDGSIIVNATGGTTPYQYNIGGANQNSNTFNNLASGIYLVMVIDTNACTDTLSIDLSAPNAPVITSTLDTNVTCNGLANGSIQVTGTAATTITYTLNPGAVSNATGYFNNLAPNSYSITLSDASNCTVSTSITITEPTQLNIDSLTSTLPSCAPGNDGSIIVNATGGTMPYQYNIGGANQNSNTFNNLASGIYLVTVTDTNACGDTMSIDLSAPNAPVITSTLDTNVSCNGLANGSIQVTGTAATAITYTLNPGALSNATGYFNNLAPNSYSITLSDASNCTVSTTVTITQPNALNIDSLTATTPSCSPGNDGSIVVNISGGTAGYQYNIGGANQSFNVFTALGSATYLVTVTDTNSCIDTMSIALLAPGVPTITSSIDTNVSCNGAADGSIAVTGTGSSAITYTLNPGAISNATGYFNNLAPNTYSVTLSDATNCTISTTVTITEPATLNIDSLTSTLPSCSPGNDGIIIVNATGGSTPYQYNVGGANQSSNSFTSLASGIYLVTVTDTNACTDTMSIDLSAPNAPVIVSTLDTNVTCNGLANGSIQIAGTAATTITYTLNPGAVSNATGYFNNLAPNSYSITLSDASNCTVSTSITITEPAQLNIDSLTSTLPSCAPGNDGSILVNATGGTTPYQYNIGGANQTSNTFNNLASGIYLVTVTDTNACGDTMSIDLSAPNAPVITSTLDTNVSCNGLANGSVQVTGTASTAITYTLNPGAVSNATGYFNNLAPNTYSITLSDASSCTVSTSVAITEPTQLNIDSLTSTLPSCAPGNDGSIIVNATGGTTPYQYNVGGPNQSSNTFNNLASGIYLVTVTDTNACTDTMSIDLSAPNAPVITSTLDTNVSCNGLANGSVQVTGTASTAITYTLNPGAVSNGTGYFSNLAPNTYSITLSDASGCTVSTTVYVIQPNILNIDSLTSTLPSCSPGNDGSIIVNATGGTTSYQYNVGGANQSNNTFNNLASGIYLVTVTDTNSCTDTMSVNLTSPIGPSIISVADTNIDCNNANNGSVQVSATGTGTLTYTLNPGSVSNTNGYFGSLAPNTYTITVSDPNSCSATTTVSITQPTALSIDSLTSVSPSCSPGGDGSIVVNVTGGTTPYQFNIGGANQSSNAFNNLTSATYLVTVTDTNNCVDTMSVNLSAPNAPTITSAIDTNVSCNGLANGSIQVSGSGASAITYTLNPGTVSNATGYFNNLAPNTYSITLSDASSCTISTSVVIMQPSALTIDSLSLVNPSCSPGGDGSIVANVTGGTTPYQYNIGGANQASNSFASLVANTYLVTVIDSNNCTDTMSVNLVAPGVPLITSVIDTSVSCFAQNDGAIQISATANSIITYTLNPGAISNASGYFNNLAPNAYTITVSDASNCSTTTLVNITQPNQLSIDSLTATAPSCNPGGDGSIVVNVFGGTPNYQYNIGGANQSSNSFANLSATTYLVTVTDTNSCTDTMSITLAPPSAPMITNTLDTNVTCNGLANGSIQVSGTGATAITYTLNPGALSNATGYFNNLVPNAYTITLSDASNCTVSTSVTITQPSALSLDSLTTSIPTCSPGGDGSILANVTGGTMPYQYNIGGANQMSNSFANLVANTYLVTVIDSNNCTDTMSVALLAPSVPVITSVVDTNVSCFGQNNASIQIAGTGNTALTYTLNPGSVSNATGYFNNLAPITYSITLSDASNCTVSSTVNITQPNQLSIDSLTAMSPSCIPGGDGSLLVNISGGTPNFQYNIGGANQSSNLFNNLIATTYLVTVADTNSCTDTMSITLASPSAPAITSTLDTNVTCNGLGNGSIQVSGTGASAITYTLNPGAISNATGYFNNLVPNTYTITLSDASNCSASTSVIITEPTTLSLDSLTTANPTCSPGADASIVVNASGGTMPYQYNIGGANQASNSFANLVANTYLVTVIDSNNCTDTMSVILAPPASPVVTSVLDTNVTCNGQNNGSTQVTGAGSSTLSYTLNPGAITNATGYFNNLASNTYTITLSDASNCTVSTTVNITAPASLNIDSITSSIPSCSPGGDGSIIVFANGGTVPYSYNIGGANQLSNTFNSLASNTYLVTVTDSNSCMDTMTVDLSTPAGPAITSVVDSNVSCNGLNNGSVQVMGTATNAITYTLNPGAVTNATGYFNNLAPNAYTITLSDANNCTVSTTINITEPVALTWNPDTVSNISCNGLTDGSINITASGGTTPLSYTLNPGAITNATGTFTNLGVNTYTIVASDANACSISTTIAITEPTLLVLDSLLITNETCSPGTDGAIVVYASGGTTTYQYNIGGAGQVSNSFANLVGGSYTVTVTDANNCSVSSIANISSAASPSIDSVSATEASCDPGCDATAIINVTQGTSSTITYSINGASYQNANNFASLCANNYNAYIQDANGCTDTLAFVINTSTTPVIDSMLLTSTLCFGDSNATATVLASGGNGQLTYNLTPTSQSNTTGIFTGLNATNYMVSVVDVNGCQVDSNFTIINAPSLQYDSVAVTDALCFGDSNGTITVTTNGGTGTITFGITPSPSSNTTGAFINLAGNTTYTIVASDANACSISTTVFIPEPIAVGDSNVQVTNVTCNGASDGSFSIQGTGGTPAYSYNVMPGNLNNNTGSFTNLSGNTYTVTITDANSCTHTATVVVVEPTSVFIDSASVTDVSCNGLSDGILFVSASGGVGSFNYNLMPGNVTNATGIYNGLLANTYTVVATDANACSVSTSLTVNEPLPIVIDSLDITNVSCNGLSDGVLTVFSSGGNGGNTYLLNPGSISTTTGIFNNLAANTYTVTVTDSQGCSVSIIDSVTEPLPIVASYTTDSVSCFGGSDGQIQITTTGGTQPYSLTLSPGAITNNNGLFTGLSAGSYTVNIVDSNGCPITVGPIELQQPTQVLFTSVNTVDVTCFGDSTGEISVIASGGTGSISYSITPNVGSQSPLGNFTGLVATTYTITATDANMCSTTTNVTINQNPEIRLLSLNYSEPTCHGDSNGSISFTATGGVGSLLYSFEGGSFNGDTIHTNLPAGNYSLLIQDALGCQVDTSLILIEPDPVGIGSYTLTPTTCEDSENGSIEVQATGGRPYYTYYRRPGISFNRTGIFTELKKGLYTITIKDSSGCAYDTTFNVLPSPNLMQSQITKTDLPCKGWGNEGTATVNVNGGIPPYTYLWSSTPAQIEARATGLRFGYHFVEIIDAAGCKIVDTTYINPGECCTEVFLPNAFSPNGDGQNDEFRIISTAGIKLRQFEIYNRWGQRIWQTYNSLDSWNGMYKGEVQPVADYYYVFRYQCLTDGKEYIKKGNLTLIR